MEYLLKKCPKCKRDLQVPADLKTCICMYCGETFLTQEQNQKNTTEASHDKIEENYRNTLENIALLIDNYEVMLFHFSKNNYTSSFEEYLETGKRVLQPAEEYAALSDMNKEQASKDIAKRLIEIIDKTISTMKYGPLTSTKGKVVDQFRFFLAVYTVPMILKLNYSLSDPLSDEIISSWHLRYPKFEFKKGDYDKLQEGFERKGWCYITTAVCDSMEKPDDCYELTAFRNFRDSYMQGTQERVDMVEEYYLTAPVIVAAIGLRPDSKEMYEGIWNSYLRPCLKELEDGHLDDCKNRYVKMVKDLKELYYIL